MKLEGKVLVAQGGGPTAVINQSLVGVVLEARKFIQVTSVYGAINGVRGIVNEDFLDLTQETTNNLEQVALTPSSALLSTRDKPDEKYCKDMFQVMRAHDVRYFFYIGGNDSANTAYIVNSVAEEAGYDLRAFHVPKTVDNDLLVTDHCPGYGTAARFVACALMGDDLDNRALPGVKIDVIMGRHAGFLTAAAALGKKKDDDGPHLLYFPERPVSIGKFLSEVEAVYKKLNRCVVAVSEGMCDADGETWAKKIAQDAEKDPHGNIQLSGTGALADFLAAQVKNNLKIKRVRADTFGYLQRSFAGLQSAVDVDEARRCGRQAVLYAMQEDNGSVAMKRLGNGKKYGVELFRTELKNVAEHTKSMPAEFLNADGNGVTPAFVEYALPLTGELPKTEYLGGYPKI